MAPARLLTLILLVSVAAAAPYGPPYVQPALRSGACGSVPRIDFAPDGSMRCCNSGTWGACAGAGGYTLPDATSGTTGGVRLDGDLAGTGSTATSPQVVDDSHAHTTTTISGLDAGADFSSGTLPQARGGTGAGALTCSAGQHLTSNGAAYSCSADTAYTLPAATAAVLGGVRGTGSSLTCAAGTVASGFAADGTLQCVTDQTGGGGGMALPYVIAASSFGGF